MVRERTGTWCLPQPDGFYNVLHPLADARSLRRGGRIVCCRRCRAWPATAARSTTARRKPASSARPKHLRSSCQPRHHGELHSARPDRHRHVSQVGSGTGQAHSDAPYGQDGRVAGARRLPVLGRGELPDPAGHWGGRRAGVAPAVQRLRPAARQPEGRSATMLRSTSLVPP